MQTDSTVMTVLANMGFAAVAAGALWAFLAQRLIPQLMLLNAKLVEIVEQNSRALAESVGALREVVTGQKDTAMRLGKLDDRMLILEEQHKRLALECPFNRDGTLRSPTEHSRERVKADG